MSIVWMNEQLYLIEIPRCLKTHYLFYSGLLALLRRFVCIKIHIYIESDILKVFAIRLKFTIITILKIIRNLLTYYSYFVFMDILRSVNCSFTLKSIFFTNWIVGKRRMQRYTEYGVWSDSMEILSCHYVIWWS